MEILNLQQLTDWQPPRLPSIIGEGILYQNTRMLLFGKYKTFKSMHTIHLGFCIASGIKWFEHSVSKRRVLVFQTEIPKFLFRERVLKYVGGNKLYPDNIYFWYEPYLKLDRTYGQDTFSKAIEMIQPEVVIIDPLYKVISGSIEASHDVSLFTDYIDKIKDKYNFTPIIVHHETKDIFTSTGRVDRGSESMHGSIFLLNWADAILQIHGDELTGRGDIKFKNMRHAQDVIPDIRYRLNRGDLTWTQL